MFPPNPSPELPSEPSVYACPGLGSASLTEPGTDNKTSSHDDAQILHEAAINAVWPNIVSTLCRGLAHDYRNTLAGLALFSAFAANELEPQHPLCNAVNELQDSTQAKSLQLAAISDLFRTKERRVGYLDLTKTLSETVPLVRMLVPAGTRVTYVNDQGQIPVRMSVVSLRQLILSLAYLVKGIQQPQSNLEFSASRLTEFPPSLQVLGASPKPPCAYVQMTCSGILPELAESLQVDLLRALNSEAARHELKLNALFLARLTLENAVALVLESSGDSQMRLGFAFAEAKLD